MGARGLPRAFQNPVPGTHPDCAGARGLPRAFRDVGGCFSSTVHAVEDDLRSRSSKHAGGVEVNSCKMVADPEQGDHQVLGTWPGESVEARGLAQDSLGGCGRALSAARGLVDNCNPTSEGDISPDIDTTSIRAVPVRAECPDWQSARAM